MSYFHSSSQYLACGGSDVDRRAFACPTRIRFATGLRIDKEDTLVPSALESHK
jgi:hypothetical protein